MDGLETRLNAPDNSPVSTTASISGITDGHGVEAVTEEIMALTGVQQVRIKLNAAGISTAVISSTHPLSEQEIGEAVAEAGYLLVSDNA
nr:heavy-metal-associated domain-containing protein [Psychromicrobium silvestre]